MDFIIRDIREDEHELLEEFLYQAVFVSEGFEGEVPRSVIREDPKCRAAYEGFGTMSDDRALVAVADGTVVGACWVRTTEEYGHIDASTPSFSISLYKEHRGRGIGTALMKHMLEDLRRAGYARASLSVQKENPALRLYGRLGFRIVGNGADDSEWLMVCELNEPFSIIETERLILRPWFASDAKRLYVLASDPEVGPSAGWPPHENEAASAAIIGAVLSSPEVYAVVLRQSGELIGCAGFNSKGAANMLLDEGELELGYWIGKSHWGCGYAIEAACAVVEHGFEDLGLIGIHAAYFDGNDRSRRVLEKLGFAYLRTEHNVDCPLINEMRIEHFAYLTRQVWRDVMMSGESL